MLPGFVDVHADRQVGNVQPLSNFFSQAGAGTLPSVSWISPDPKDSERSAALVQHRPGIRDQDHQHAHA